MFSKPRVIGQVKKGTSMLLSSVVDPTLRYPMKSGAVLCAGPFMLPRRGLDTNKFQTSGLRSSFIIDTRKSPLKDIKKKELRQTELKELLKDHPPSVQLQLVEAYRKGFQSSTESDKKSRMFETLTNNFGKIIIFGVVFYYLFRSSDKIIGGGAFPKILDPSVASFAENADVNFGDVQGCDEVKKELQDVVEFLRNPEKFNRIGAKLPKGVLLIGPPGVGKTLLAKAVSGEAQVPFLYVSGSSFEEVFVGMGASRVRQLFAAAKQNSPCLIFIDEIDSVGRNRTSSPHHPYANQTINQLLAEMDGFQSTEGIIVLGATNQAEDLDKALLRPGRFDVQIHVSPPTFEGRIALLQLYLRRVKTAADLDVEKLAHGTVGYTGADIQNLVNQAAITAGLRNELVVGMTHLWEARDKLLMGPAKRKPLDEQTNRVSAYHEAGHALMALLTPESTPLHKVTIIPRGDAGGHTSFLQDKDLSFYTRAQLLAQLDVLMAGRVGEELAFGSEKVTTGAGDDFRKATALAQNMVVRFGLSSKLGPRVVVDLRDNNLSQSTRDIIDKEVDQLLSESLARTRSVLSSHSKQHKTLAEALLHFETLTKDEVNAVLAGKMKPPKYPPSPPASAAPSVPSLPSVNA
ncbi:ATP dependent zinc metalloprotease YME1 [Fasciola gigantica]|uniref:ATP dependent zinc metalloprotease YME1 n=1 Tax=Fasciola gigantica TaxID=46835 RepID=A0A504YK45_FASGI|nr:ATP dependent zinc metalloprotease YME1 [Fasciola gigantica]